MKYSVDHNQLGSRFSREFLSVLIRLNKIFWNLFSYINKNDIFGTHEKAFSPLEIVCSPNMFCLRYMNEKTNYRWFKDA